MNDTLENLTGLTAQEVEERRARGKGEKAAEKITKSRGRIVRDNICTLFNFLNFLIAGLLFAAGAYSNMLFIAIIILNILIGIAQELKAKKLVDELSILNRPVVRVRRDGRELQIAPEEVVKDDLLVLESGSQVCNDAEVVSGQLEVNESLLTGESDAVGKEKGGKLYSGSFILSGKAYARVIHVGGENYASRLVDEVRKEKRVESELLGSMRKVTRFTSLCILPLGILLFLEALLLRHTPADEAIVTSAAALLGMLPKGLVLLISVSLAAGVIRLAGMKILVQNIYSLETLAHVDTLCLDKTGTLTDGRLKVRSVIPMGEFPGRNDFVRNEDAGAISDAEAARLVGAYMAACDDNNATFLALKEQFPEDGPYEAVHKIPFSSRRKWGCISFEGMGSVFIGAPERLFGGLPENLEQELEKGRRVVAVGYYGGIWVKDQELPEGIRPLYSVVLEDHIRPNAAGTLEFFRKEGVEVKVISGDHVKTVSMIAKRAGLHGWKNTVDLSALEGEIDYDSLCLKYTVFARTTPAQKRELVRAMKRQGCHVAMTGDGVNDLLALREADCSIAVADGSDASRQISQIVLLDSDFTNLPQVVMEGRRVIHNVTRTAQVFFIKTVYSVLVSLFCLLANQPFPFIPIQITLIDAFVEAWPSFVTIAEAETRTVMYLTLILISLTAVIRSCIPFNRLRVFLCVTMFFGAFGALLLLPSLFEVSAVSAGMGFWILALSAVSLAALALTEGVRGRFRKKL